MILLRGADLADPPRQSLVKGRCVTVFGSVVKTFAINIRPINWNRQLWLHALGKAGKAHDS
jgi:hypothetical protein